MIGVGIQNQPQPVGQKVQIRRRKPQKLCGTGQFILKMQRQPTKLSHTSPLIR